MAAPWFKFYAADYLLDAKVDLLPLEAQGILVRLWCLCSRDGSIPKDLAAISRRSGVDRKALGKHWAALLGFFIEGAEGYISERMAREALAYEEKCQKLKQSASIGGKQSAKQKAKQMLEQKEQQMLEQSFKQNPTEEETETEEEKALPPLAPQGGAAEAEKPKRKKRTRDPLPLNRVGGTALEAFEEARACWPMEIYGWNERNTRNEARKISIGNIPQAQKFFLQLIEEGHATAQELYACAWVAVEEWKRTGYLWIPHLSTFYGPDKETWAQFLPKAKQALQTFQEVG